MRAQIDILAEVFQEWLRIHDLDYDCWIYTQEQWLSRGEEVLKDAELVIAFENQFVNILNYTGPWEVEDELQDLAEGFGYRFWMGNHWNIGFYPLDDWPALPAATSSYPELLGDSRWATKRKRILSRCKGRCEECGSSGQLEVHHCYYRFGRYPWQYPDAALLALCRGCHKARAKTELEWRGFMPELKAVEIKDLQSVLEHCLYWFDRGRLFSFLRSLGSHESGPGLELKLMLETKGHPEERLEERSCQEAG